ncbi:hypothetical protein V2G26_003376 [Clonostachys chloroleuca]
MIRLTRTRSDLYPKKTPSSVRGDTIPLLQSPVLLAHVAGEAKVAGAAPQVSTVPPGMGGNAKVQVYF